MTAQNPKPAPANLPQSLLAVLDAPDSLSGSFLRDRAIIPWE